MPSLEASLRNFAKARANWRPPRPWRSAHESRVIKRLVWQWWHSREPGRWSGRAVGRYLGISHTWIQKLVREFAADPREMQQETSRHIPATFEQLSRAQEETRKEKDRGWLLSPRRWRMAEIKIGDTVARVFVPTKAEQRRQTAEASGCVPSPPYIAPHDLPVWARGLPYYSPENPCDPLIAIKHAMQNHREGQLVSRLHRRWRPGRRWPRH